MSARIFYSASTRGFHDPALGPVPIDAVSITTNRHAMLLEQQSAGGQIVPGPDGHPRIERPAGPTVAAQRARQIARVKREATRRIEIVAPLWRQLNDVRAPKSAGARERFAAIDAIRAASDVIERAIAAMTGAQIAALDVAGHPAWPEPTP